MARQKFSLDLSYQVWPKQSGRLNTVTSGQVDGHEKLTGSSLLLNAPKSGKNDRLFG